MIVEKQITGRIFLKFAGMNQQSSSTSLSGYEHTGYDGFGGHHQVDEFPKPRGILFPKKKSVKVITKGGSGSKVQKNTLKNFFQNTFEDDF